MGFHIANAGEDKKILKALSRRPLLTGSGPVFVSGIAMTYVLGVKCKECGHRVPVKAEHVCEACFGPYEVEYDYAKMKGKVTRQSIERGPKSLWRYKDLLPVDGAPKTIKQGVTKEEAEKLKKQFEEQGATVALE